MEMNDASPVDSSPLVPTTTAATSDAAPHTTAPAGHTADEHTGDAHTVDEHTTDSPVVTEPVADAVSGEVLLATLGELTEQVKRFHERSARSEEIIRTMQSRITDLQGDQIQALLKPTIQRFAGLHAQAAEAQQAARDRNENAAADFSFFMAAIEDALGQIDFDSVGAAVGATYDPTRHHATSTAATGDRALDKTIQRIIRQGFTLADAARVSIPAQVTIYQYTESLASDEPAPDTAAHVTPAPTTDPSITL
jgi:molecular chaperone GrpE (heat shock protein)